MLGQVCPELPPGQLPRSVKFEPDLSYGDRGLAITQIPQEPHRILALPDGGVLVLGWPPTGTLAGHWRLVRLLADGRPDESYGLGGVVDLAGTQTYPWAGGMAPQFAPDGSIVLPVVVGSTLPPSMGGLMRLRPDGSPDASFDPSWLLRLAAGPQYVQSFSVRPDGFIVALVSNPLDRTHARLVRLTPSGAPDPTFAGGTGTLVDASIPSLHVADDGAITLSESIVGPVTRTRLLRYTANGAPDPSWGSNGITEIPGLFAYKLLPAGDGALLITTINDPTTAAREGALAGRARDARRAGRRDARRSLRADRGRAVRRRQLRAWHDRVPA